MTPSAVAKYGHNPISPSALEEASEALDAKMNEVFALPPVAFSPIESYTL